MRPLKMGTRLWCDVTGTLKLAYKSNVKLLALSASGYDANQPKMRQNFRPMK